ncbi:hypothetical protein HFN89_02295 [Rhizobium laguerreae]|nr:hypothetical protein [Rhizobium laguerreae]
MESKDYNAAALVPPHGKKIPTPNPEWNSFQSLVWYDQPLLFAMGNRTEPYLGFAANDQQPLRCTYFLVPFTVDGIDAYMAGDLTLAEAVELAGGDLYYSEDLKAFRRMPLADMPDDDRVHLPQTGRDSVEAMERMPSFPAL